MPKSYLLAGLALIFWATSSTAIKLSTHYISISMLLLICTVTSFLVLLVFVIVKGLAATLFSLSKQQHLHSLWLGALNPVIYYYILFTAYSLLPAQEALVLNFTWPICLTLLAAWRLKHPLNKYSALFLLVSFIGVVVIATRGNILSMQISHPWGAFLALSSALLFAIYFVSNVADDVGAVVRLCLNFFYGSIFMLIVVLASGEFEIPHFYGIAGAMYLGLFEMSLAFISWITALKLSADAAKMSQVIYLTPFLALCVIALVLREPIHASTLIGLVIIVIGILGHHFSTRNQPTTS